MNLQEVISDIAESVVAIDRSQIPFKQFLPGVGPYGEPQLVRLIADQLRGIPKYTGLVETKRTPDLLIRDHWALEFKIARPFGNNGAEAENWTVNLLHPYPGNVSALGDCLKLSSLSGLERKASIVIGYEHEPPVVNLDPLISSFEVIAAQVLHLNLGPRHTELRNKLVHPIHQRCRIFAWEVLP